MMLLASKWVAKSQSVLGKYAAGVPCTQPFYGLRGRMRGAITHPVTCVDNGSTAGGIPRR